MRFLTNSFTALWNGVVDTMHVIGTTWGDITCHSVAGNFAVVAVVLGAVSLVARKGAKPGR